MNEAPQEPSTVDRMRLHYRRIGLDKGWSLERFNRLCRTLRCRPSELGALVNMPEQQLKRCLERKHFPPLAALHFALLERAYFSASRGTAATVEIMPLAELVRATGEHHHE